MAGSAASAACGVDEGPPDNLESLRKALERGEWFVLQDWQGDDVPKEHYLLAVKKNGRALQFTAEWAQDDDEIVMAAVQQDYVALKHASERLKGDRKMVLTAVAGGGVALYWASKQLQGDREVVLRAVRQTGKAIEYASPALRGDQEVVAAAIQNHLPALEFASKEVLSNDEFLLNCFHSQQCWKKLQNAHIQHCSESALKIIAEKVKPMVVIKISMLSGKSCALISAGGHGARNIRFNCARFLGIGSDQCINGRLILSDGMASEELPLDKWSAIKVGEVNYVQLVLYMVGGDADADRK